MKPQWILPTVMILINLGSAIVSCCAKDFRMGLYWFAAAVLNICVTYR